MRNVILSVNSRTSVAIALLLAVSAEPALAGNTVTGTYAVVSGGDQNAAEGSYAAVGGGEYNSAAASYATVAGGEFNQADGSWATIAGGQQNQASSQGATVGGGYGNNANAPFSAVLGGDDNTAAAQGATVPGGNNNYAGGYDSFAAGYNAVVRDAATSGIPAGDYGTFVWADSPNDSTSYSPVPFTSTGPNQFLVRANGGFALNTTPVNSNVAMTVGAPSGNPYYATIFLRQANSNSGILVTSGDATTGTTSANNAAFYVDQFNGTSGSGHVRRLSIDGSGNLIVTAQAYKPGGGSWAASSDGRLKKNVKPLDHALDRLLQLHGVTFEYSHADDNMHPPGTFTGFIAQDVQPKFPNWIGHDAQGYLTVGPQGFEALTVEALRQMKSDDDARMAKLEAENTELRTQLATTLAELRRQVAVLSAASSQTSPRTSMVTSVQLGN